MSQSKEYYIDTSPTSGRVFARRVGGGAEVAVSIGLAGFLTYFNPGLALVTAVGIVDGVRRFVKAETRPVKRRLR